MNISGLQMKGSDAAFYLAAIIESSRDAVISKTLDGMIVSWNKSAERVFGFTAAEAIGQHISLIIPPDRLPEEGQIIEKISRGESLEHYETIRMHKDGSLINISVTISPVRNQDGTIIGASKIARDIEDRKKAEETMFDLAQRKDDFIANMSHELRTPMNAVVGLTNILLQSRPLTSTQAHYLETLKVSADNLLVLINDVLDFSKLEQGAIFLEEIPFNLKKIIEKIHVVSSFKAREKTVDFFIDYKDNMQTSFIGDPLRIHQILNNLVTNALKFTDKGRVDVVVSSVSNDDGPIQGIIIQVRDTGIGIETDNINHIFEKFSQADTSIARRYGGSGLGLSICKNLIDKMGGTIQVESTPGVGTCFTVTIPLRKTIVKVDENIEPEEGKTSIRQRNVLIVEDHESNALVTSILLEEQGLTYDIANNGLDALRKFKKTRYDVILMDIQMPELDGIDTTRTIRRIEHDETLAPTPIIAMTAHVMERDKDKCLSAGMDDFLSKPFERQMLFKKIDYFLRPDQREAAIM